MEGKVKQFLIDEPLANAVLQYLVKKPYGEVAVLIGGLMQLKETQHAETPPISLVPKEN